MQLNSDFLIFLGQLMPTTPNAYRIVRKLVLLLYLIALIQFFLFFKQNEELLL